MINSSCETLYLKLYIIQFFFKTTYHFFMLYRIILFSYLVMLTLVSLILSLPLFIIAPFEMGMIYKETLRHYYQ